ncbi:unnamed protein product [Rotaria sp. Silwood1]|nr:unnamed protein product [Rotaria sp. Silwood1]
MGNNIFRRRHGIVGVKNSKSEKTTNPEPSSNNNETTETTEKPTNVNKPIDPHVSEGNNDVIKSSNSDETEGNNEANEPSNDQQTDKTVQSQISVDHNKVERKNDVNTSSGHNEPEETNESTIPSNSSRVEETNNSVSSHDPNEEIKINQENTTSRHNDLKRKVDSEASSSNFNESNKSGSSNISYSEDEPDLLEPVLKIEKHQNLINRLLGCVYGQALGDAYGLSTEFENRDDVAYKYPDRSKIIPFPDYILTGHNRRWTRGDWTDDTDQWILILETLTETNNDEPKEIVFAKKLKNWIRHGYSELGDYGGMGLGANVSQVVHFHDYVNDPLTASKTVWERGNRQAAPNGAVMRCSASAFVHFNDREKVISTTKLMCKTTHFDPRCIASCLAVCLTITYLLKEEFDQNDIESLINRVKKETIEILGDEFSDEHRELFLWHIDKERTLEELNLDEPRSIGYTYKCLASGFYGLRSTRSFEKTLNDLIRYGGDADTNGAVCGTMYGARHGYKALPYLWLREMPFKKCKIIDCQSWNTSDRILPWESYIQLNDIQRPLGLTIDRSSLAHHHFAIGYFCFHSFMYDEARDAFNLAINIAPTFIEAHIGKMLACKHTLWSYTDFDCGLEAYNAIKLMLKTSNITLSSFQSSLLSTVYQWYANQSSITNGERAFLSSITNLSETYPNETDIRVLWGLSLLNVAFGQEFQGQIEPTPMMEAREIFKTVLRIEPNHPGALHYLIHAYDVNQVDIAEKATDYALTYNKTVLKLSHAQHMPAHIWMRTGAWLLAMSADRSAIQVSLALCATKLLNRSISISSIELESVLIQFNTTNQISSFLLCDAENRAHSTEWLSYSRLQTGDWLGSIALLNDLFIADNQSFLTPNHYLPFAYRTQARTIVDLFFWFPYSNQFLNKIQSLLAFNEKQSLILLSDNTTGWYPIWTEAGYRFADCLKLLTTFYMNKNTSDILSTIDIHLARFIILSNRTNSLSKYISNSILMMIPQILGIRHYINGLWQECLNELNTATQIESMLISESNSPTLIFARSSELFAMHLIIIYEQNKNQLVETNSSIYMLNGTETAIDKFPLIALKLYKKADQIAPNRAINTLGMARANAHLNRHNTAVGLYQQLSFQMTSSNNNDEYFLKEANDYLDQHSSAIHCSFSFILIFFSMCLFYF